MASLALLAGSVAVAVPASADHVGKPTVIKDVAGDANYVNDGGEFDSGDTATPTSDPGLDVLDATIRPTHSRDGKVNGFAIDVNTLVPLRDSGRITMKTRTQNCADILIQYVNAAPAPRALLRSGCSSEVMPLAAEVNGTRLTLTVPYAVMPAKSRKDKLLQTINVFSQLHLAYDPVRDNAFSVLSTDTTLASKTYRLR